MSTNVFTTRLRRKRQELGFTQGELAQKSGLSRNSIQKLEKSGNPKSENLVALCRALSVSTDWLLGLDSTDPYETGHPGSHLRVSEVGARSIIDEGSLSPARNLVVPMADDLDEKETYNYALVPLAEAFLSAGGGAFVPSEKATKMMAFRKDWLNTYATSLTNVILMFVQGDSMSPTIMDGDMVMVDLGRRSIHDGGIYAIGKADTISIKRLELLVAGQVRVISDNRTEYPPYEVDLPDLRIIGRIIWYARELIR